MIITSLPTDVLHILVWYYTDSFEGLIRLSSICKMFREVAYHSSLWLKCPLKFFSPPDYRYAGMLTMYNSTNDVYKLPLHVSLYSLRISPEFGSVVIQIDDDKWDFDNPLKDQDMDLHSPTSLTETVNSPFSFSPSSSDKSTTITPYQKAFLVHKRFREIFLFFHYHWDTFAIKRRKIHSVRRFVDRHEEEMVFIVKCLGTIFLLIVIFLFVNITEDTSATAGPSPSVTVGFICIYLYLVLYISFFLAVIARTACCQFLEEIVHDIVAVNNTRSSWFHHLSVIKIGGFIEPLLFVCVFTGLFGSALLLHVKLSFITVPSFCWTYILLPLWFFPFIEIGIMFKEVRKTGAAMKRNLVVIAMLTFLFFCINLSLTLIANYYDHQSNVDDISLRYAMIPLLPVLLAGFIWMIVQFFFVISFRRYCVRSIREFLKYVGVFIVRFICVSVFAMLTTIVYLQIPLSSVSPYLTFGVDLSSIVFLVTLAVFSLHCSLLDKFP
jgi:hypothetical protein